MFFLNVKTNIFIILIIILLMFVLFTSCFLFPKRDNDVYYKEIARIDCDTGGMVTSLGEDFIDELILKKGEIHVTYDLFEELYFDYWGDYSYDEDTKEFSMTVGGGNYVPDDIDNEGTLEISDDGSTFIFEDFFFGTSDSSDDNTVYCGHEFEKVINH